MQKYRLISLLLSIVFGVAITIVSGFFQTPFTHIGVDVIQRGAPETWSVRVIPLPTSHVIWDAFLVDAAFWIVIAFLASFAVLHFVTKRTSDTHAMVSG